MNILEWIEEEDIFIVRDEDDVKGVFEFLKDKESHDNEYLELNMNLEDVLKGGEFPKYSIEKKYEKFNDGFGHIWGDDFKKELCFQEVQFIMGYYISGLIEDCTNKK